MTLANKMFGDLPTNHVFGNCRSWDPQNFTIREVKCVECHTTLSCWPAARTKTLTAW